MVASMQYRIAELRCERAGDGAASSRLPAANALATWHVETLPDTPSLGLAVYGVISMAATGRLAPGGYFSPPAGCPF